MPWWMPTCVPHRWHSSKADADGGTEQHLDTGHVVCAPAGTGHGILAYYTLGSGCDRRHPGGTGNGQQVGSFLVLGVIDQCGLVARLDYIGAVDLVGAVLLGLFPKRLPKTVIHQAAQRIMEQTNLRGFGSQFSTYLDDTDFWPSLKRLFSNRLLMLNLLSIMFLQSDGLTQEWRSAFVAYFLKPPVMAVGMLVAGLVISKAQLSARTIAGINISLGLKLVLIFVATSSYSAMWAPLPELWVAVDPALLRQSMPLHSDRLHARLPENSSVTYFSPCYAGCTRKASINSFELYEGCSCLGDQTANNAGTSEPLLVPAVPSCQNKIIIFQVLSISAAFLLGISVIGKTSSPSVPSCPRTRLSPSPSS
ncbi:solute carrier organic anion transporter family member 1A1-like [Drosophila innubila]|uniref:solute carrier organic anion transporter family member 1A1-like n=1 Tax=Drosophila innubila TaxID=198719 RepID=UPI00148D3E6A|nr:solute carrier organic anion transporter family member 1A1-like [Drosophila innubila]